MSVALVDVLTQHLAARYLSMSKRWKTRWDLGVMSPLSSRLCERGFSESGRQKFGMLLSQSVQSCLRTEKERIRAAMAIVDGANSIEVVSKGDGTIDCVI
jgi:hypothetical protein